MATIYTHRDANIRKTWALFSVFLIVVIGLGWVFAQIYQSSAILIVAVIFSTFMSIISYWYSDKIVLAMTGAKAIQKKDAPELYNIVENLSIVSGLPMPRIYLIPDKSPNAFATGRDPEHAVVAVTAGILDILDRAELEGVLAHELSHVGNRDMLVSTVAVVLVGFISVLADMFTRSLFWGRFGDSDNRRQAGVLILVGLVISILAPIAATLIQLAISRKREFLADASGALLTRYPEGLASALEKISYDQAPLKAAYEGTAHLFISNPFKGREGKNWFRNLFLTHPPIEERIKILRGMEI